MAESLFIDNAKRKRIVTFWIPVCLGFLHVWATILVISALWRDTETIRVMFSSCTWGIGALVLLLISDKALEFIITRITGASPQPQVIEKTTTEKTVIASSESTKDVNIQTSGDVNVSNSK